MQFSKWVTLLFGALCLIAVAAVLQAQHLYYMAAILLTLPGISYGLGWYTLRGLEFTRELPATAWEGEEGTFLYVVRNVTRLPRYFLTVREPFPPWIETQETEPPLFNVGAGETTSLARRVKFTKRGVYRVQAFEVAAIDPLGVFAFAGRVACEGELVVYPQRRAMDLLEVSGSEVHGLNERTLVAMHGSSVDPDGVREYRPGDPLRRIHWGQTARTGKLNVIEYEESQSTTLVTVLDLQRGTDAGKGAETTLEDAVRIVASAVGQAIRQGASVRMVTARDLSSGDELESSLGAATETGQGQQQLYRILDALARVEAVSMLPVSDVVADGVGDLLPGTALMVVTSRADFGLSATLTRYTGTGADVSVVYVDPATYPGARRTIGESERERFVNELMMSGAKVFVRSFEESIDTESEAAQNVVGTAI